MLKKIFKYPEIIWNILLALILSSLAWYLIKPHDSTSLLIGFIITIIIQLINIMLLLRKIKKTYDSIYHFFDFLREKKVFNKLYFDYWLNDFKLKEKEILISGKYKSDFFNLWKDAIINCKTSWKAISYTNPDEVWIGEWEKDFFYSIQMFKIKINKDFILKRVFVIDDEKELKKTEKIAKEQIEKAKIKYENLRYIEKAFLENLKDERYTQCLKKIDTYDISLADNDMIYLAHLDRNRNTRYVSLKWDEELAKNVRELWEYIFSNSKEFSNLKNKDIKYEEN